MTKLFAYFLLTLFIVTPSIAQQSEFEEMKKLIITKQEQRIAAMQTFLSCVKSAKDDKQLKVCRDKRRSLLKNISGNGRANRRKRN